MKNIINTLAQTPESITTKAQYLNYIAQWQVGYKIVSALCTISKCSSRMQRGIREGKAAQLDACILKANTFLATQDPETVKVLQQQSYRASVKLSDIRQSWGASALATQMLRSRAAHKAHAKEQCKAALLQQQEA
jgi:hypothetical protein